MAETKKFVVVDGPINHDHELYQNGEPIELPKKAADRLGREKKVVPFKEEKPKADDKGADAKTGDKLDGAKESEGAGQEGKGKEDQKDKLKDKSKGGKK